MRINVKVTPNAKVPELVKIDDKNYHAKVNARASEGKANIRLEKCYQIISMYQNLTYRLCAA